MNGLSKLRSLRSYSMREDLFQMLTEKEDEPATQKDGQSFEQKAVQCYKCDPAWPICLYDFTFKNLYSHHYFFKTREDVRDV